MSAENVQIHAVHPQLLDVVWADVTRLVEASVETSRGKFTLDAIRTALEAGDLVLWMVLKSGMPVAVYTTRVIAYPQRRGLAVDWVGGTGIFSWLDAVQKAVEQHARRNGCTHIEGFGRAAWGRLLRRYGWEPEYTAYRMELTDEQG